MGGTEYDLNNIRKDKDLIDNKNIYFIGSKPFKDISSYMRSADVFLLPNSSKSIISERFTSPLKLFSYMTIKKPIVVSDLPSMREILDENMVYFFESGSEKDLVDKIEQVFKDKALSDKRIQNAYKKVQDFSWINRANRLLKFIGYTEANIK
jgi:glycosyltransferase involved in cell wall biosynthesis